MSAPLDRLRALRAQAGAPLPASPVPVARAHGAARIREVAAAAPANDGDVETALPTAGAVRHLPAGAPPRIEPRTAQSIEALRRLLGMRDRVAVPARGPVDRVVPGDEIAPGLRLIATHLPMSAPAGLLSLAFTRREGAVDPRSLLFFDTETTGLAGGTGTRAFMIGAADWHHDPRGGDGLRIRQLLVTTMAAERAMLDAFAAWLSPGTVLSSYNGRCYDAPLLKTRYRLARMRDPLAGLDHVDLLFPTRRRYRGVWENCRLGTVERELLQILREDDLPGSQAPAAWLSFLRGGPATNLRRVAAHNHQDVVTLAQLLQRLVDVAAAEPPVEVRRRRVRRCPTAG